MNKINQKPIIIGAIVLIVMLIVIIIYIGMQTKEYTNYEGLEISSETEKEVQEETPTVTTTIKVHIAGSVVTEGIVELEEGARIADAIQSAGGTTADANMQNINLAYKLQDGQKIYIPNVNEDETAIIENGGIVENTEVSGGTANSSGKININTATQTELELITGIGPSTATKIIEYRTENGKFQTIEDIKNVPGIGDSKYESMKEQITV